MVTDRATYGIYCVFEGSAEKATVFRTMNNENTFNQIVQVVWVVFRGCRLCEAEQAHPDSLKNTPSRKVKKRAKEMEASEQDMEAA